MFLLLADTRKKLLWLWLAATAFLVLLVFVQTLTGKYEEMEGEAWRWVFAQLLPVLVLLFVAVLGNRNPSKVLKRTVFWTLYWAGASYLLLVLATLLAFPLAAQTRSIQEYLQLSYSWLLPFQALLLALYGMLYFRKEIVFLPNETLMQEYVSKKAEFARRAGSMLQIQALETITQADGLGKTLALLRERGGEYTNEIVLLQSRHAGWKHNCDLNLAAPDVLQRELNRLTLSTIDLIERIEI